MRWLRGNGKECAWLVEYGNEVWVISILWVDGGGGGEGTRGINTE